MKNQMSGGVAKNRNDYNLTLWGQEAPKKEYFDELKRVSKNRIIWGGNYFISSIQENSQCWVVWDKGKPEGVGFADCELAYTSFNLAARIFRFEWNGMIQGDMKNKEIKIHPTQKPVKLYTWLLSKFAKPGDVILDTHVGSASSLIACERMGFQYCGFEIDKEYYQKAKERLEMEKNQIKWF
jgi:site-specific DNA-methyltransferase (adenine-specific)